MDVERATVVEVERAICKRDYGRVCLEAGKFIEKAAAEIHIDIRGKKPRNAKVAIDVLMEEKLILKALEKCDGNRTKASKLLEISHRALLYKIKRFKLEGRIQEIEEKSRG